MDPVEDGAVLVVRMAPHQGDEGLHEAQAGRDAAEEGVRVLSDRDLGPSSELHEDQDHSGDGQHPGGHHEEPVPDEPLVQLGALGVSPGLLVVASQEDSGGGREDPSTNHECPVQSGEQLGVGDQIGHDSQRLGFGALILGAMLPHGSVHEGALSQEDDVLVAAEVESFVVLFHFDGVGSFEVAAEESVLVAAFELLDGEL